MTSEAGHRLIKVRKEAVSSQSRRGRLFTKSVVGSQFFTKSEKDRFIINCEGAAYSSQSPREVTDSSQSLKGVRFLKKYEGVGRFFIKSEGGRRFIKVRRGGHILHKV